MTINGYLFAGYAVIWTILFFYLLFLQRRQERLARRIEQLHGQLSRGEGEKETELARDPGLV